MTGFVTRWAVLRVHDVAPADLDAGGAVHAAVVGRWTKAICDEYLDRCAALQTWCSSAGLRLTATVGDVAPVICPAGVAVLAVSAGATEVRPGEFTIALRLRPLGVDDAAVDARCVVRACDPVTGEPRPLTDAVHAELVALEQNAAHVN